MKFETTAERQAAKERIITLLTQAAVGGTVSHKDIRTAAHVDDYQSLFYAAQASCLREYGAVFENIRGVGYKRVPADEGHRIGQTARKSIRAKTRTAKARMQAIDASNNSLAPDARKKLHTEIAVMGIIEMSAGRSFHGHVGKTVDPEPAANDSKPNPSELLMALSMRKAA